jgi:predicted hydrocarbon binding protein
MTEEKKIDNYLMRCWLESVQGIVGSNGLRSILNYAHLQQYIDNVPPDNGELDVPRKDAQALFLSLYELFGHKGVRNLSLRTGREFARIGLEGRKNLVKAIKTAARLLPETKKIQLVLKMCATQTNETFSRQKGEVLCWVQEEEDFFLLTYKDHFESDGIIANNPVCGVAEGTIHYVIEWATGHNHDVEEIECRAMGYPTDVLRIWKRRRKND